MTAKRAASRHPALVTVGLVLLALVVLIGVCEWMGWPFLRKPFESRLAQRLERPVSIGEGFRLHLLGSLRMRTDTLAIGAPKWAGDRDENLLYAEGAYLKLPWSTLFGLARAGSKPPRIEALEVDLVEAILWRRDDGKANWSFERADAPEKDAASTPAQMPEFDRLVVRRGVIALDDAPTDLELLAHASTSEGRAAGDDAKLEIRGNGTYRRGAFDFTIESKGVLPIVAPEDGAPMLPVELNARTPDAKFSFDGRMSDVIRLAAIEGKFSLAGSSLGAVGEPLGVTLPTTAPFKMNGGVRKEGEVWRAQVAAFDVGSTNLSGEFEFDRRKQPPRLTGALKGRNLDVTDLAPALGARTEAAPAPKQPAGKILPQREFDVPSLKVMNADVRIDLARLDLHTDALGPLTPLRAELRLDGGVLTISDLLARASGGQLSGKLALDARNTDAPKWNGDLRLTDVELSNWIKVKNPRAPEAREGKSAPSYVGGKLNGRIDFSGAGRSTAAMLHSLDGTVTAWVRDGRVSHLALEAAGLDIAESLGLLIRKDEWLPLNCAVVRFIAKDGVLNTDVGIFDTSDTTVFLLGSVSFDNETLDLTARAAPKDFSPVSLRTPLHVEGTFADPRVKLDMKKIGIKALAAAALAAVVNPLAAVLPLIDTGERSGQGCDEAIERLRRGGSAAKQAARDQAAAKQPTASAQVPKADQPRRP